MTLQSLAQPLPYPSFGIANNSTIGLSGSSAIASGQYYCFVFRAREAMAISHVALRCNAATGSPTADIRIETIDASTGLPSGTLWNSPTNTTNIVTGTLTTTTTIHALTATANITAGDYVAVKIAHGGTGTSFTVGTNVVAQRGAGVLPYVVVNTGTPTKGGSDGFSVNIALGSSSTSFYLVDGLMPAASASGGVTTAVSTATQDAIGMRFRLPFKARCVGHLHTVNSSTYGEFTYGVYDDSNSELSSSNTSGFDADMMGVQAGGRHMHMWLDNPVTLSANTWYRYLLFPTSATAFNVYAYGALNSNLKAVMPGGTDWHYVKKAVGGAWTDSLTTDAIILNLLFDQLDDGVGSGGGGAFSVFGG